MARIDMPPERLTEYERAVCYYTLPKVTHPIAFGLIVVYVVCLLEALGVMVFGLLYDHDAAARLGAIMLGTIIVVGTVAFTANALFNELRQRRALAVARSVPDAVAGIEDIPDPFGDHVLLRHPLHTRGDLFPCTDNEGTLVYFVESSPTSAWWKVKDPQDAEVIRIHVEASTSSFSLGGQAPGRLSVYRGTDEIARIRRRFSFTRPRIIVECLKPEPREYVFYRNGFYRGRRLVGRIYYLHQSLYLDMERSEFHDAILGLFITMT